MLVAAADVQMRGIWCEVLAVAPTPETWVVEALYLDGPTESPAGAAFRLLEDRVLNRDWPDAYGRTRKLDALGVDSGYQPHSVYAWTRKNQRIHPSSGQEIILALKGWDGWGRPPIGTPSLVDINLAGSKVRKGVKVWPVGTWSLKAAFYADVRKEGLAAGKDSDPAGYCHFPDWLDQNYFKQLTAEFLTDEKINGKVRRVWKLKASERDNHLLDCRVYNLAPAEYLGLSSITPAEWAALAKERGGPDVEALPLFAVAPSQAHRPRGGIICRTWPS
jgi:phage terminase large subunit GpA-like protein